MAKLQCFFSRSNSRQCSGKIRRGRGARDSAWLGNLLDRRYGYCEGHQKLAVARMFSGRGKGARADV